MHDDYRTQNNSIELQETTRTMLGGNRFPEIIDQEDFGRCYPTSKPIAVITRLHRFFRGQFE
jgi:hypothetical protein